MPGRIDMRGRAWRTLESKAAGAAMTASCDVVVWTPSFSRRWPAQQTLRADANDPKKSPKRMADVARTMEKSGLTRVSGAYSRQLVGEQRRLPPARPTTGCCLSVPLASALE